MNADSNKKRNVSECAMKTNGGERTDNEAIIQRHSLNNEETLIEPSPHREDARQDDNTKDSERRDTGGFLLLTYYREIVSQILADPEATVDRNRKKQPASSPPMNKV